MFSVAQPQIWTPARLPTYQDYVASKLPGVYWRMNEASGSFIDRSGSGRNGAITGTPTYAQANIFPATADGSVAFASGQYGLTTHPFGAPNSPNSHTMIWRGKVTSLASRVELCGYHGLRIWVATDGSLQFDWASPNYGGTGGTGTSFAGLITVGTPFMASWTFTSNGSGAAGRLFFNGSLAPGSSTILASVAHLNNSNQLWAGCAGTGAQVCEGFEWYSYDRQADIAAHWAVVSA